MFRVFSVFIVMGVPCQRRMDWARLLANVALIGRPS